MTAMAIALLRNTLGDFHVGNAPDSGDAMMQIFRAVLASSADGNGAALSLAADGSFRQVTLLSATLPLISPLLLYMPELKLRDTSEPVALAD